MRRVINLFDAFLRSANGVFEFSTDPDCLLRLRRTKAPRSITIGGVFIAQGAPLVELHFLNEHMPTIPSGGSDVGWAARFTRLMIHTFRETAHYIDQCEDMRNVTAVCGTTVLSRTLWERMGFTVRPAHSPLGRFGLFWDNMYTYGLMWTYNPVSVRGRNILRLERIDIWMTRQQFMDRYLR